MKDIKQYIIEKQDYWNSKIINKKDLLDYCVKALKESDTFASDIQKELNQFDGIDDLKEAYDNGAHGLENYTKFENELLNMLADNDKYSGLEGDIVECILNNAWDLMDELYNITSK